MGSKTSNEGWLKVNEFTKYLRVLGLKQVSTVEDLQKTYRSLVSKWHPDRFQGNPSQQALAEEKIKQINLAYNQLQRRDLNELAQESSDDWAMKVSSASQESFERKLSRLSVRVQLV